jgi:hypothetical protein
MFAFGIRVHPVETAVIVGRRVVLGIQLRVRDGDEEEEAAWMDARYDVDCSVVVVIVVVAVVVDIAADGVGDEDDDNDDDEW